MGKPIIKRGSLGIRNITKPAELQETQTTKELVTSQLLFDYSTLENFSQDDVRELINIEKKITINKNEVGRLAIETGKMLEEARGLFDRYSENPSSYMNWYETLGFNKDQVSLLRGRYKLFLKYPDSKIIHTLSDAEIKQITNKKAPGEVIERVVTGEIRTAQGIKKAISRALEIDKFKNLENDKDGLLSRLGELDSLIPRLEEELRELKTEREKVKEKIKYRLNNMTSILYRIGDIYQLRFGDGYGGNHTLIPGNVVKVISERGVEKGTVILKNNGLLALRIKNDEIELHNLADNNLFHFKLIESR